MSVRFYFAPAEAAWSARPTPREDDLKMRKARSFLLTLLLAAITIRFLWLAVAPLIPYIVGGLVVVVAMGFVYYKITRW